MKLVELKGLLGELNGKRGMPLEKFAIRQLIRKIKTINNVLKSEGFSFDEDGEEKCIKAVEDLANNFPDTSIDKDLLMGTVEEYMDSKNSLIASSKEALQRISEYNSMNNSSTNISEYEEVLNAILNYVQTTDLDREDHMSR